MKPKKISYLGTLWENDELFKELYFEAFPGYYDTADVGFKDEQGFVIVSARADDVINVAGHRLSSSGIEEAILYHPEISECAVVEVKDEVKGSVPFAFIVRKRGKNKESLNALNVCLMFFLKDSKSPEKELISSVVAKVRKAIGPVAAFKKALVVKRLPKTRSGKIPRATLRNMINNKPFKIPVTIDDASAYDDLRKNLVDHKYPCGPVIV